MRERGGASPYVDAPVPTPSDPPSLPSAEGPCLPAITGMLKAKSALKLYARVKMFYFNFFIFKSAACLVFLEAQFIKMLLTKRTILISTLKDVKFLKVIS